MAVLAYSSVSQMGPIALAPGIVLLAPETWPLMAPALLFFTAHHAFAKGALFLGTGVAIAEPRPTQRRLVLLGLLIPAAALAALLVTSGYLAKEAPKQGLAIAFGMTHWLILLALAGTTAMTVLMAWFLVVLARRPAGDACSRLATPRVALLAICAFFGRALAARAAAGEAPGRASPRPPLLPIGIGLIVSLLAMVGLRLAGLQIEPVRPGEVLALFSSDDRPGSTLPPLPRRDLRWWPRVATLRRPDALSAKAESWVIGGAVAVAVVVVMALLEAPRFDDLLGSHGRPIPIGTQVSPCAPGTDPSIRYQRTRLPPREVDEEATLWPGIASSGRWQPALRELAHRSRFSKAAGKGDR